MMRSINNTIKVGRLNEANINQLMMVFAGMKAGTVKHSFLCIKHGDIYYLLDGMNRFTMSELMRIGSLIIYIDYDDIKEKRIVTDINDGNMFCVLEKRSELDSLIREETINGEKYQILFDSGIVRGLKEFADATIAGVYDIIETNICDVIEYSEYSWMVENEFSLVGEEVTQSHEESGLIPDDFYRVFEA